MLVAYFMMTLLLVVSTFLIFIVLLQRGRGGGLAGALGGMGGQSAFGTKAGDVFTKITVILAIIWIVIAAGSIPLMRYMAGNKFVPGSETPAIITAPPVKGEAGKALPGEEPTGDAPLKPAAKAIGTEDEAKTTDDETTEDKTTEPESSDEPKTESDDKTPSPDKAPSKETPPETKDEPKPEESNSEEAKPDSDEKPKE